MEFELDMSMMFAMHDALRRQLVQIARFTRRPDDNPAKLLQATLGWELFKKFLTVHHTTEDDVLWPDLRGAVAGNGTRSSLADELEAEHSVIEPLLAAIDTAAADQDYGHQRFGDIVDELTVRLSAHLRHEETDGLPLIDASLTPAQWQHFAQVHAGRLVDDASRYLPWLLGDASQQTVDGLLAKFPPHLLAAYREEWGPRYAALDVWNAQG
jgi:hypothetical protein